MLIKLVRSPSKRLNSDDTPKSALCLECHPTSFLLLVFFFFASCMFSFCMHKVPGWHTVLCIMQQSNAARSTNWSLFGECQKLRHFCTKMHKIKHNKVMWQQRHDHHCMLFSIYSRVWRTRYASIVHFPLIIIVCSAVLLNTSSFEHYIQWW